MMRVSFSRYKERLLSDAEIASFSWPDLAVQYTKWPDNVQFWERAMSERTQRNKELRRPRIKDLEN